MIYTTSNTADTVNFISTSTTGGPLTIRGGAGTCTSVAVSILCGPVTGTTSSVFYWPYQYGSISQIVCEDCFRHCRQQCLPVDKLVRKFNNGDPLPFSYGLNNKNDRFKLIKWMTLVNITDAEVELLDTKMFGWEVAESMRPKLANELNIILYQRVKL